MRPDFGGYLASWSRELTARQDRVRLLIGEAHWLTDGHHKEAILREFLTRYLPSYLMVSRGFVRPPDTSDRCSPEIDVLIVDPTRHPPFFNEGGVTIAPPSSVLAYFEVKTSFKRESLRLALKSTKITQRAIATSSDATRTWRCICFFDDPARSAASEVFGVLAEELKRAYSEDSAHIGLGEFPTCIVLVSGFIALLRATEGGCLLRQFALGDLALPSAFADMFSSISQELSGSHVAELDQMIEAHPMPEPLVASIKLGDGNGGT